MKPPRLGLDTIPPMILAVIAALCPLSAFLLARNQASPTATGLTVVACVATMALLGAALMRRKEEADRAHDAILPGLRDRVEERRRLVLYDQETGLLSRWYFEQRLAEETRRCERYDVPLTLMTLRHPNAQGAALPSAWAEMETNRAGPAAERVRVPDLAASMDEGEFAVCFLHCDAADASVAARRLMEPLRGSEDWELGLATCPDDGFDGKALLKLAAHRQAPWRDVLAEVA
jgi:GGDEF domain-containing protein